MQYSTFVVVAALALAGAVSGVTEIKQCENSKVKVSNEDVKIKKCNNPPCILKRNREYTFEYTVKPEHDVSTLTNNVFARILGLPLPFIGVDSTDACQYMFTKDGQKVGCPLKAGQEYVYKNSIKVLPIYPLINVEVHWGLVSDGKNVFCYEVPAKITN